MGAGEAGHTESFVSALTADMHGGTTIGIAHRPTRQNLIPEWSEYYKLPDNRVGVLNLF